ncbi:MAG TPA: efflux RND transporter periplasmic adaptor subunit [Bacteroidales bacterium]|nr:efflux RND transporter periplasmic adaptor subunit [Bacteroidales bacterium]HSA44605.1 efflux RND transporter periplasmic adaptor subunit [Bacteroidales bacterium]
MKKLWIFAGLLLMIAGCNSKQDKKAELARLISQRDALTEQINKLRQEIALTDSTQDDSRSKTVVVTTIQPQTFNHFIEIQGKVDGDENIGVNPRTPGVVSNILVKVGDRVSRGQTLMELDAEVTRRSLDEVKERLAFATTVYNKYKNLWDQKIGSEIEYLSAKNNKESLERTVKTLEETLEMSRIVSPISGTVEEIPVKIGQAVSPGFPAIRVINFSRIKVVAELAESYARRVKAGDEVNLYFPDYNQETSARIAFASKYINPVNRTFQIEVDLNEPGNGYKANMVAVVRINDYSNPAAFVVPINAVQKSSDGHFVFLARPGKGGTVAHKQPISLGSIYNGLAEVTSGLEAGQQVITMGYQDLFEGQVVKR